MSSNATDDHPAKGSKLQVEVEVGNSEVSLTRDAISVSSVVEVKEISIMVVEATVAVSPAAAAVVKGGFSAEAVVDGVTGIVVGFSLAVEATDVSAIIEVEVIGSVVFVVVTGFFSLDVVDDTKPSVLTLSIMLQSSVSNLQHTFSTSVSYSSSMEIVRVRKGSYEKMVGGAKIPQVLYFSIGPSVPCISHRTTRSATL